MRVNVIVMAFAAAGCVWFAQSQYNPIDQAIALSDVPSQPSIFYHEDGINPQAVQFASNSESLSEAPSFSNSKSNPVKDSVKTISNQNEIPVFDQTGSSSETIIPFGTSVDEVTQSITKPVEKRIEIAKKEIVHDFNSNIPKGIPLDPDSFPTDKLVKPFEKFQADVKKLVPQPIPVNEIKPKKTIAKELIAKKDSSKISSVSGSPENNHTDRWNQITKKTTIDYTNRYIAFTGRHAVIDFGKPGAFPKEPVIEEPQFEELELTNVNTKSGVQAFGTGGSASELELTGIIIPEEDEDTKHEITAIPLESHDPTKLESVVEFLPPPPHKDVSQGDDVMVGFIELPPPPKRNLRRPLPPRRPFLSEKPIYVKPF